MRIKFKPRVIKSAQFALVGVMALATGAGLAYAVDPVPEDNAVSYVQDVSVMPYVSEQPAVEEWAPLDDDLLFTELEARCAWDFGYASDDYVDCTSWVINLTCQFEPLPDTHENYGAMDQRCSWENGF